MTDEQVSGWRRVPGMDPRTIHIHGHYVAFEDDDIVVLDAERSVFQFIPVFPTEKELRAFYAKEELAFDRVVRISEPKLIEACMGTDMRLITNIRYVDDKMRFSQIMLKGDETV